MFWLGRGAVYALHRDLELELLGLTVVRFDDTPVADDPAAIARDLLTLLKKAAP